STLLSPSSSTPLAHCVGTQTLPAHLSPLAQWRQVSLGSQAAPRSRATSAERVHAPACDGSSESTMKNKLSPTTSESACARAVRPGPPHETCAASLPHSFLRM